MYYMDENTINENIQRYCKNIKINVFFKEDGEDINTVIKELILNNCNPLKKKMMEI